MSSTHSVPSRGPTPPAPSSKPPLRPPPPGGQSSEDAGSRRSDVRVALIGAASTILAAVIAGALAVNINAVEISVPQDGPSRDDLSETVTSLENENASLVEANEALTDENEELQRDLEGSAATPTTDRSQSDLPDTSPAPPGPSGEVARSANGRQVISQHGLDLDSTAADWGVAGEYSDLDVVVDTSGYDVILRTGNGGAELAVMSSLPSFDDCQGATGLRSLTTAEETVGGTHLCVRTSEGSYAYVGIVSVSTSPYSAVLDLTVWE